MAFYYVDCDVRETGCCELSIEIPDRDVKIGKIQFETISDYPVKRISDSETLRKRSGKFVDLSGEQKREIIETIRYLTRPGR